MSGYLTIKSNMFIRYMSLHGYYGDLGEAKASDVCERQRRLRIDGAGVSVALSDAVEVK